MFTARMSQHKGRMASVAFHQFHQFRAEGKVSSLANMAVTHPARRCATSSLSTTWWQSTSGSSTTPALQAFSTSVPARAQPFNDVALTVVGSLRQLRGEVALSLEEATRGGMIDYVPFPDALAGKCKLLHQADLTARSGLQAPVFKRAKRRGVLYGQPEPIDQLGFSPFLPRGRRSTPCRSQPLIRFTLSG